VRAIALQQRIDEVDPGLDGEHVALLHRAQVAQEWPFLRLWQRRAVRRQPLAAGVMHLQAEVMADAVRQENAADAGRDHVVGRHRHDAEILQDDRNRQLGVLVHVDVGSAWTQALDQRLLFVVQRIDQRGELAARPPPARCA
jgi:hypothetical protein